MATVYVGSFTTPTTVNHSFGVTGVGFQPKAGLFWFSINTSSPQSVGNWQGGFGVAASTSARGYCTQYSTNGVSSSPLSHSYQSQTACLGTGSWNGASWVKSYEADFVSWDSGGFTLDFSTVAALGYIVNYMVWGGSDISADVVNTTTPTSTGNFTVNTAIQPDCCVVISSMATAFNDATVAAASIGIGWGTSSSNRGATMARVFASSTASDRYQSTTRVLAAPDSTGAAYEEVDLVSFNATPSITFNEATSPGVAHTMTVLCLKGMNYAVGTISQPAATGSQTQSGLSIAPLGLILISSGQNGTGAATFGRFNFGAGVSSSQRSSIDFPSDDGGSTRMMYLDRANMIALSNASAATLTNVGIADLTSLNSDGWTLNWTTADGSVRQLEYLAFAAAPVTFIAPRPYIVRQAVNRAATY